MKPGGSARTSYGEFSITVAGEGLFKLPKSGTETQMRRLEHLDDRIDFRLADVGTGQGDSLRLAA